MSTKKVIIGVVGGISLVILLSVIFVVVIFSKLAKQQDADYYKFGQDQIPAIKLVVGKRKISNSSAQVQNGVTTKTYNYTTETGLEDLEGYVRFLVEEEKYVRMENGNEVYYVKESVEDGYMILIYPQATPLNVTITIRKDKGQLKMNGLSEL